MPKEIQISSLTEYVEIITDIISKQKSPNLLNERRLFFRGMENRNFDLVPSIARFPSKNVNNSLTWYEERFILVKFFLV